MGGTENDQALLQALTEAVNSQSRSTLAVMQGMQAEIAKVVDKMDRLANKMDDVQARLITLEQKRHGDDITDLRAKMEVADARIGELETVRSKAEGAAWAAEKVRAWMPFVVGGIALVLVYFGIIKPSPPGQ